MGKIKKLKFKDLPEHKKFLWLVADNVTPNDILFLSEQDYGTDSEKHAELITFFKQPPVLDMQVLLWILLGLIVTLTFQDQRMIYGYYKHVLESNKAIIHMISKSILKISLVCVYILGSVGCTPDSSKAVEDVTSALPVNISIESRSCDRITAILPQRGRYDGISLHFLPDVKTWDMKFEHIPYRNEVASPIGLLSLEEIAEIASLIIRRGECANPPYATREFKAGDKFLTSIDWWLVTDLYTTGRDAAQRITENYKGPMTTKPMSYKEVRTAFKAKGFVDSFCRAFEQPDHACLKLGCEYSEQSDTSELCEPEYYSLQQPFFSNDVKDVPMDEVCKLENCGLEKESKIWLQLIKL